MKYELIRCQCTKKSSLKNNKSILVPLQCTPFARWVARVSCFTVQDSFIDAVRGIIRDRYQDVAITCIMEYDLVLCMPKRLGQKISFSELTLSEGDTTKYCIEDR